MNPADQPAAVHPPPDTTPALIRGLCENIEHDLSHMAWLLAGRPQTLPEETILSILDLTNAINEIRRQIED